MKGEVIMISPSRMKELAEEEMADRECTELGRITIGDEKFILNKVINLAGIHMYTLVEDKEDGIEKYSCNAEDLGGMLVHLFTLNVK